jgi:hypothetical protein
MFLILRKNYKQTMRLKNEFSCLALTLTLLTLTGLCKEMFITLFVCDKFTPAAIIQHALNMKDEGAVFDFLEKLSRRHILMIPLASYISDETTNTLTISTNGSQL